MTSAPKRTYTGTLNPDLEQLWREVNYLLESPKNIFEAQELIVSMNTRLCFGPLHVGEMVEPYDRNQAAEWMLSSIHDLIGATVDDSSTYDNTMAMLYLSKWVEASKTYYTEVMEDSDQ